MIKYLDLIQYTKENHISWDKDLFDVLKGFFEQYSQPTLSYSPYQEDLFAQITEFIEPADGEYSSQDLMNLFDT